MDKERLDKLMVLRNLVSSRARAVRLIEDHAVLVNGILASSPAQLVTLDASIELLKEDIQWVSRAGLKLEHALDVWKINVGEKTCLDIGASTGGFTQVLLARGARKVIAVDVGHDQVVPLLRDDPRVDVRERTHILTVTPANLKESIDIIVVDVSFISLTKIIPKIAELLSSVGEAILLIKPQFEAGKGSHKGVVVDPRIHREVTERIAYEAGKCGFFVRGMIPSPIMGGDGNTEFLMHLSKLKK